MSYEDARMIIDYGQFEDVVSFDITHKANKANRLFAMFVAFMILRVVLMYDKTINSFIWLYKTSSQAI